MADANKNQSNPAQASQPAQVDPNAPRRMFVKSTLPKHDDGGTRTAFYERHADHPGGEAFVVGDRPVEVAVTPDLSLALREGRVVEATADDRAAFDRFHRERQEQALSEGRCPHCGGVLPERSK